MHPFRLPLPRSLSVGSAPAAGHAVNSCSPPRSAPAPCGAAFAFINNYNVCACRTRRAANAVLLRLAPGSHLERDAGAGMSGDGGVAAWRGTHKSQLISAWPRNAHA